MFNFSLYKKILVLFTLPILVLYSFFLFNYKVPVANGTDIWYKIKEYIIIPIVRTVANALTAKVHNRVKDVIRGVGGQGPAFIQNWREEINNTESRGLDVFRSILGNTQLCPHLDSSVKQAYLADKYTGISTPTKKTGQKVITCIKACGEVDGNGNPTKSQNFELLCLNKPTERDRLDCVAEATASCVKKCSKNENFNTCFDGDGPDSIFNLDEADCNSNSNCYRNVINAGLTCVQKTIIGVDKKGIEANTASFVNDFNPAGETPFSVLSQCTLPKNFDPETFGKEVALQGGLTAFRELLQPQNNKLGFFTFIANPQKKIQQELNRLADTGERNSGDGYKPFREGGSTTSGAGNSTNPSSTGGGFGAICDENLKCSDNLVCTAGRCLTKDLSGGNFGESCAGGESGENSTCTVGLKCVQKRNGDTSSFLCLQCGSDSDCSPGSTCNSGGACEKGAGEPLGALCGGSIECKSPLVCSDPVSGFCQDPSLQSSKENCPDDERVFGRCTKLAKIVTPGQILNSAIGGTLGSQVDKLVKARDWTDLLAQLIEIVGGSLTNFLESKLLNENPSVISDGNQYAQQNQNNGVNDQNSNGTDAFNNLNQCLANCDQQSATECASKESDKQSVCENTKRLTCYSTCGTDTQGNNSNREQKRRIGDTCQGDKSTKHPDLSYTPVSQNDEANPSANANSICANGINADPRPGCTPSAQDDCKQKVPLICYKQDQSCIQCVEDSDCDIDFPELKDENGVPIPGTKRICDKRFSASGKPVGVCVRQGGGNKEREACLDNNQCAEGLICNGNHRCKKPTSNSTGTSSTSESTASTSADFDLFIEVVDIDEDDDLVCSSTKQQDNCTLGINPDTSLNLDIFNNTSAAVTSDNRVVFEQISGATVSPAPTINFTPPSPLSPQTADIDLSELGANTSWKAYIKAGNKIISNTIYFKVVETR